MPFSVSYLNLILLKDQKINKKGRGYINVQVRIIMHLICNLISDWAISKIKFKWVMFCFIWLAMLLFETKLRTYLRMGLMYSIIHLRIVKHGPKLCFTVQLMCYHNTKFQPVYPKIYLPK